MTYNYYQQIPVEIKESLGRYVHDRCPPGGFLRAVLENDLCEACAKADEQNKALLFTIVKYIYNEIPSTCWGSPARVQKWLDGSPT